LARGSPAGVRPCRWRGRGGLLVRTAGKELAVKRADEPEDSPVGRRARVWRVPLGAGEGPQVPRKRAPVAVLREAIVDGPLGAEHLALDRNAQPRAADGVPL